MPLLPPSTNDAYHGSPLAAWFLAAVALLTIGPGCLHSFLPDGGTASIAGLRLGADQGVVLGVFRWQGATQIAWGLALLGVALRYRTLVAPCLALVAMERALAAADAWILAPPSGHHPPEHYGTVAVAALALVTLALALRPRRLTPPGSNR